MATVLKPQKSLSYEQRKRQSYSLQLQRSGPEFKEKLQKGRFRIHKLKPQILIILPQWCQILWHLQDSQAGMVTSWELLSGAFLHRVAGWIRYPKGLFKCYSATLLPLGGVDLFIYCLSSSFQTKKFVTSFALINSIIIQH